MEKFGLKQNFDSALEREPFDVEKGIERERTVLEKFRGKAKDVARVLLFVSALSAGSAMAEKAWGGETRGGTAGVAQSKIEQVQPKQDRASSEYLVNREHLMRLEAVISDETDALIIRTKEASVAQQLLLEKHQERMKRQAPRKSDKLTNSIRTLSLRFPEIMGQIKKIHEETSNLRDKQIATGKRLVKEVEKINDTLDNLEKELEDLAEQSYNEIAL